MQPITSHQPPTTTTPDTRHPTPDTLLKRFPPAWRLLLLLLVGHLALLGWNLARSQHSGQLKVTFLDVGQGDSTVVETPSGKVLVVDTGGIYEQSGDDAGRRIVAPFLRHEGINHIDVMILTHPHADHIGGAATLIRQFSVGQLLDNGQATASPVETAYLQAARDRHVLYQPARPGMELDFHDGVTAQILAPTEQEAEGVPNNASVVTQVRYGRTTFLLTGDAEAEEEADLLRSGQPLGCDVLKVGHHGSHTSTTSDFLAAAHPRCAVISVGAHNLYGHPSPEVITRLQQSGAQVFRTDENGAVTCLSDGIDVRTQPLHTASP